jgi:hypothetical protein
MTEGIVIRSVIATITVVVALAVASAPSAYPPSANVTSVSYRGGAATLDLVVAISRGIDAAARTGNANWGLDATVTYVDQNGTVQTLDSGRLSIKNNTHPVQHRQPDGRGCDLDPVQRCGGARERAELQDNRHADSAMKRVRRTGTE